MVTDLGWICSVCKVIDYLDGHIHVWKLHKGLVFVGSHIELRLYNGPEGRAQFSQLFLGSFIGEITNVEHL